METDIRRMIKRLITSIKEVIVGNDETINLVTEAAVAGGHVLDEDTPGVGKTLMMESFAKASEQKYSWIQGTPDLRPSDITGGVVLDRDTNTWNFRPGPMFADIVVMDEGNRIPPKTQASVLEAMQNKRVTVDGIHHPLPQHQMVLLTQNTRNSADVYDLPGAMVDRFAIRLAMQELSTREEAEVYERTEVETPEAKPVIGFAFDLIRKEYEMIHVDPDLRLYTSELMAAARQPEFDARYAQTEYRLGRSTRPGEWLIRLAKAGAFIEGKRFITASHLQERLFYVVNHRLKNDYGQGIDRPEGLAWIRDQYVPALIEKVPAPILSPEQLELAADLARNK